MMTQGTGHDGADAAPPMIDEAGRQLRAPWAASVAGLLFAGLFTAALVLMRGQELVNATDSELVEIFATGGDLAGIVGGLYLAPFAGIMFLWFVAVIRDQVGEREDRFFATVFLGSGLIFVALLFAASAVATAPLVGVRYLGQAAPTAAEVESARALSYTLLFAFATRAAAVFLLATATIGIRSAAFPRWFAWTGFLLGIALLLAVAFWDWVVLVLPVWVAVVSLFILRRERTRQVV
jgi:hypothetical protein